MKTAFIVLTPHGLGLALRYRGGHPEDLRIFGPLEVVGPPIEGTGTDGSPYATGEAGIFGWSGSLRSIVSTLWADHDAIIAVMALGIVVRLFGPVASDKRRDPAVVALDEAGRYAISVLGGHAAGANSLAENLAKALGAQAIVTTASEAAGLPAVDQIGRESGWIIERAENLTRVAASVVRRSIIGVWQDAGPEGWWRRFGEWPDHFRSLRTPDDLQTIQPDSVLWISDRSEPAGLPEGRTLVYRPPTLVVGIGCRRGTTRQVIENWVDSVMTNHGFAKNSLATLATVMLKIDEPGLIDFARSRGIPLIAFPSEQLVDHPGIETPSERVRSKVGLVAVAEPSALRAAGAPRLLIPKQIGPGVTVALARRSTDHRA